MTIEACALLLTYSRSAGGSLAISPKLAAEDEEETLYTRLILASFILLLKMFSMIVDASVPPNELAKFISETTAAISWR